MELRWGKGGAGQTGLPRAATFQGGDVRRAAGSKLELHTRPKAKVWSSRQEGDRVSFSSRGLARPLESVATRAFVPPAGGPPGWEQLCLLTPLLLALTVPWGCVGSGQTQLPRHGPGFVGTLVKALRRGTPRAGLRAPENSAAGFAPPCPKVWLELSLGTRAQSSGKLVQLGLRGPSSLSPNPPRSHYPPPLRSPLAWALGPLLPASWGPA